MTFNLIGTGMTNNSLTAEALEILKTADKIYLENYTVNFPYPKSDLEKKYSLQIKELPRELTENEQILEEAKTKNIALLVYGDCLSATTHTQLIVSAKQQNIPYKIFNNASIMTVVARTGLSLYKFGKTTSMPNWQEHTNKPTSFINYIKENNSIKAHTLILTDIGLEIKPAIEQLKESAEKENLSLPKKIIAITHAGTPQQKIFYDTPSNLSSIPHYLSSISMPFCLIISNFLNHTEQEALENFKEN
ncbi:diphthine synthase [Methanococcoides sp. SA1]|nr:diphthine synthase [Methanococcoides sp. SA1]